MDHMSPSSTTPTAPRRTGEIQHVETLHELVSLLIGPGSAAIFLKDRRGRYLFISPAAARLIDREPETVLGLTDDDLFSPETAREIREIDARVIATGEVHQHRPVRHDFGAARVFETTKVPWRNAAGEIVGVLGITHDGTPRYQAEQAAALADASFHLLVETIPDAILVLEKDRVLYANPAARTLFGDDELHPRDDARLAATLRQIPGGTLTEARLERQDGRVLQAEVVRVPVTWNGRSAELLLARDTTPLRSLQASLARADRLAMAGTMAACMAHEISNPLTALGLRLDLLEMEVAELPDPVLAQRLVGQLESMRDSLDSVSTLLSDFKAFGRADGDPAGVASVQQAVRHVARIAEIQIRGVAQLEVSCPEVPLVRWADGQLWQVLMNLLLNAIHAIPAGDPSHQKVRLSVAEMEGQVRVDVEDTGSGIDPAVAGQIFEPFFTTHPTAGGTGLGLWISRSMVNAAGGRIEAEALEGGGTRMRIWLSIA